MKNPRSLTTLLAALSFLATAWSCSDDDKDVNSGDTVTLTTQAQVDAFTWDSGIGMLVLTGDEIEDISGLAVTSVNSLVVQKTGITEFDVASLVSVSGRLTIENNPKLDSIRNMPAFTAFEGDMLINNNPRLASIEGLLSLKKLSGTVTVTNNPMLGADMPLSDAGYDYGLFPLLYLKENNSLDAEVTLANNHKEAAETIDEIGRVGENDGKEDFVVTSLEDAQRVNPSSKVINNITFRGENATNDVMQSLIGRIETVRGTVLVENTKITNTEGFFDVISCEGSIIFRDNVLDGDQSIWTNGFRHYTRIGGDLIIENSPLTMWGEGSSFAQIEKITGNLILKDFGRLWYDSFVALKTVGGNLEISGCGGFPNLSDSRIEIIGGDLVLRNNSSLSGLSGFESLQLIGGDVTIAENGVPGDWTLEIPDYGEIGRPGWCMVKTWIEQEVISPTATVTLQHSDGTVVDIDDIEACDPNDPGIASGDPRSLEFNGETELVAFVQSNPGFKETVIDLTIRGNDITQESLSRLSARIEAVSGDLLWEGFGDGVVTTEGFFDAIECRGSITLRNCSAVSNPNGFEPYERIGGDFIIENCPSLITAAGPGWNDHAWSFIKTVEGSVRLIGMRTQMGGAMFARLETVGGDFELTDTEGSFWDLNGMDIKTIGGDLIIRNHGAFENFIGLDKLEYIGGGVTVLDNPNIPHQADWRLGYCFIRYLRDTGVIQPYATITIGMSDGLVDIESLTPCTIDDI